MRSVNGCARFSKECRTEAGSGTLSCGSYAPRRKTMNRKMLDVLTVLLMGASANLLVHSYWTPPLHPSQISKIAIYETRLLSGETNTLKTLLPRR